MTPTLRDYQGREGALGAVEKGLAAGCRRQLVSLATGLGKTVVFANLPMIGIRRFLVLAHREELLDQAADKLRHWNPGLTVQVDQADRWADVDTLSAFDGALFEGTGYAVCASVATIGRAGSRRLTRYPDGLFDAVVVDECHHATAKSYQSVIDHFHAGRPGGPLLLGFTATPGRADAADLTKVFDKVIYSMDLLEGINRGFLVDVRAIAVSTGVSLDAVGATREDFKTSELADAVNTSERNGRVVKAYLDHAADRKGIVFAADVAHSKALAEAFEAAGVDARHVDGETPSDERAAAFAWLREAGPKVLVNVGIATEGFDEPSVSVILLARPTKSWILYTQMLGRGTRLCDGKVDLLVIDLADLSSKHTLVGAAALFGLPTGLDLAGKSATKARARVKELVQEGLPFEELAKAKTLADLETIANEYKKVSLFWQPKTAPEVAGVSALSWVSVGDGAIALRAGELRAWITTDMLGHAHLALRRRPVPAPGGLQLPETLELAADFPTLEKAVGAADALITAEMPKVFTDPKARWRKDPASEKQVALLKKFRVPYREPLTKGEAGILLDKVFARRGAVRRSA
ncbi:MAG TPA: DEAD/DEAH box helicase [Thermoanaerobaculia bacterium]|nr:DEAD/DEAH box helicase [Thermoanaerobaculia bacterium]